MSPFELAQKSPFEIPPTYIDELIAFRWKRKTDPNETAAPRPLLNFINLFLLEAFIARQGE